MNAKIIVNVNQVTARRPYLDTVAWLGDNVGRNRETKLWNGYQ